MTTKHKLLNIGTTLLIAVCVLASACSRDDGDRLQRFASSQCRMVARVDMERLLRQYDCSRNADGTVKVAGPVEGALNLLPVDVRVPTREILGNPYIRYDEAVMLVGACDGDINAVIFTVSDAGKFISQQSQASGLNADSEEGWEYLTLSDGCHLIASGHTALIITGKELPAKLVKRLEKEAAEAPLGKIFADGLRCKGRTISVYLRIKSRDIPDMMIPAGTPRDGMALLASDAMDGKNWNMRAELLAADGKPMPPLLSGHVETGLLRFAGTGHNVALLAGDGHEFMRRLASLTADLRISAMAACIEGPAMVSARVDSTLVASGGRDGLSVSAAFTCAKGKARQVLDRYIRVLAPPGAAYSPGKSLSFTTKTTYYAPSENYWEDDTERVAVNRITFSVDGDLLLVTCNATPGKNRLGAHGGSLGNSSLAVLADIPAGTELPAGGTLPFGLTSSFTVTGNSAVINAAVTGTDRTFAACMASIGQIIAGTIE